MTHQYHFEARDACPACAAPGAETLYSSPFDEGGIGTFVRDYYQVDPAVLGEAPYELRRCPICSLVFQYHVGGPELLTDLYTDWVETPEDPERDIETYRSELQAIPESIPAHELMTASSFLGVPLETMKTLDYGMGWAGWARIAGSLGCESYGMDLAQPRMDYAARHGVRTVTDAQIPDYRFHFINTEQVFEHVTRPLDLARRLASALAPGGILKVSVPEGKNAEAIVARLESGAYRGDRDSIMPVQPLEHVNCFRRESVAAMAASVGLAIVQPSPRHGYAFLRRRGTISLTRPKKAIKELVRPWYQWRNPTNLYVWLRKP